MIDDVEVLVFRHVGRIFQEQGRARIERVWQHAVRFTSITMAAGAVRLINSHSGNQVGVLRLKGIPDLRGATVYGSVQRRHCDVFLQSAHGNICPWIDKAKSHPEKGTQKRGNKTSNETEDEF